MASEITLEGVAFGAGITFLRKLAGWSRPQLRDRCGWNPGDSSLSKYESGARIPRSDKVEQLADAFGVPVSTLYDLQHVFLAYVRMHPVELDNLLRKSGLRVEPGEIREPTPRYETGQLDQATERRWLDLARERGAVHQREILLLRDTLLRSFLPAGRGEPEQD